MNIVLIPGFMADAALWDDMLGAFRALGPVSHGDLGRDAGIAAMARRVADEAPDRFVPVGFSMGGYVAREVARLVPERVPALVLIATSARADTPSQARRKTAAARNVADASFSGLSRSAVVASLHPDRANDAAMIARVRAMGDRLGGAVFLRQASEPRESDSDRLCSITCPTLIVAAAQDALRSVEEARELQAGIPNAELAVIEGSGHMLPIEAPQDLAEAVVPWLRRVVISSEAVIQGGYDESLPIQAT